jgi:hypothetical protein
MVAFSLILLYPISCVHQPKSGDIITQNEGAKLKAKFEFDFSSAVSIKNAIQKIGSLKNAKNQEAMVRIFIAFQNLKRKLRDGEISLQPDSSTVVKFRSFCLASEKAVPEYNEIFKWVQDLSQIPFLQQSIDFFVQNSGTQQSLVQELIWNLENGTYYEDYPASLQRVLDRFTPPARVILPSRTRDKIIDAVLPEQIKNGFGFIRGKYYSFEDFATVINARKSKTTLSANYVASRIPNTGLSASSTSDGYHTQTIKFNNNSQKTISIKISNFYLESLRSDVQPIIMASVMPGLDEIQKLLEKEALKMLGYLGSKYPTLNRHEEQLVKEHPIEAAIAFYDAMIAERNGDSLFPNSSQNGEADAFRHFVWAAMLTRDLGEVAARKFLDAHEVSASQPPREKAMDDFNNNSGIDAANEILQNKKFENQEVFERVLREIKEGHLRILKPSGATQ